MVDRRASGANSQRRTSGHRSSDYSDHAEPARENDAEAERAPLVMQRGVSQLLYHYLPGRTVDWESGLAIVQLTQVHFTSLWKEGLIKAVLDELALLFDRWRKRGGKIDRMFPDPRTQPGQFAVGLPEAVEATLFETALVCQNCYRLYFTESKHLARDNANVLTCSDADCGRRALRQFGQVFVHGCGEIVPLKEWMPATKKTEDGFFKPTSHPIRCQNCGTKGRLKISAQSERVKDMKVVCKDCGSIVGFHERLTANCQRCLEELIKARQRGEGGEVDTPEEGVQVSGSVVARIAMRMGRYSASATYYPQTLSMLRLDRPVIMTAADDELDLLRRMLPSSRRPDSQGGAGLSVEALGRRLTEAEANNNRSEVERIKALILQALSGTSGADTSSEDDKLVPSAPDLERAIFECIAFRETVDSQPAIEVARQGGSATALLLDSISETIQRLGLRQVLTTSDLPVISATFGYTRRSFEPTYDELTAKNLPTQIRAFPSIDRNEARKHNRPDLLGAIPVLAREGEHEGLFLSLNPERVIRWLEINNINLPNAGMPPFARFMHALEPVDRYYDDIWDRDRPIYFRRYLFGLLHSLSHAIMRAASRYAGLERTSLSEYIFLPLLGTVVFDNSSSFKLGGMETLARDHLSSFLDALATSAMTCLYDAQCIDHQGACHGCLHSPEISCRVFNHGLSRSFLIGGHAPWADVATDHRIVGYWQMEEGAA